MFHVEHWALQYDFLKKESMRAKATINTLIV